MARSFNKKAKTEFFQKKLEVARYIMRTFEFVLSQHSKYAVNGTWKDNGRDISIWVYVGRKVQGVGAGLPNEVQLRWYDYSPKHLHKMWKPLGRKEIDVYYNEMENKLKGK